MGAEVETTMSILEMTGYCCSLTSFLGVLLLVVIGHFGGTHTHSLGYHCKKADEPCAQGVVHQNMTDASNNCYTAAGVYAAFFMLSLACIFFGGRGGDGRKRPVMYTHTATVYGLSLDSSCLLLLDGAVLLQCCAASAAARSTAAHLRGVFDTRHPGFRCLLTVV